MTNEEKYWEKRFKEMFKHGPILVRCKDASGIGSFFHCKDKLELMETYAFIMQDMLKMGFFDDDISDCFKPQISLKEAGERFSGPLLYFIEDQWREYDMLSHENERISDTKSSIDKILKDKNYPYCPEIISIIETIRFDNFLVDTFSYSNVFVDEMFRGEDNELENK